MSEQKWNKRWQDNHIGFHLTEVNPIIIEHFPKLPEESHVLVPLCGKSLDMLWLRDNGYHVIGNELVELAVRDFFDENNIKPIQINEGDFQVYRSRDITIYTGDFFKLQPSVFQSCQAVYDRAALIALDDDTRERYAKSMLQLNKGTQILLVTIEYIDGVIEGPPFSIMHEEVVWLYDENFSIKLIEEAAYESPQHLQKRGLFKHMERIYLLQRK